MKAIGRTDSKYVKDTNIMLHRPLKVQFRDSASNKHGALTVLCVSCNYQFKELGGFLTPKGVKII